MLFRSAILFPSILCLVSTLSGDQNKKYMVFKFCVMGISLLILYGNIYMTAIDLEAMYEGKASSDAIMDHVVHTLIDDDLYSEEKEYLFVGRISDNQMFRTTILWNYANSYARYGEFMMGGKVTSMSYQGMLRKMNLSVAEENVYESYLKTDLIRGMPSYPAKGSIQEIEGRVVIKISDVY